MEFHSAITTQRDLDRIIGELSESLGSERPDFATIFVSPHHEDQYDALLEKVLDTVRPRNLIGCTGESIIGPNHEIENSPAIAVWTAKFDGVQVFPFLVDLDDVNQFDTADQWRDRIGIDEDAAADFIILPEPFSFGPALEHSLGVLDQLYPGSKVVGGLASGGTQPGQNRIFMNDQVLRQGMVGVSLVGPVELDTVVSQGCRPIGEPFVVTKAESNVIQELRGMPAMHVLKAVFEAADKDEKKLIQQGGLHIGSVVDETKGEFGPGDFLIRNLMGVVEETSIAVAALIRPGQTIQFHLRDAASADADMCNLMEKRMEKLPTQPKGALLFSCNGRGQNFFPGPHHDISVVNDFTTDCAVAGFFAMGEIGPVGNKTFIHGFTSSLVLFREPEEE